MTVIGLIPSGVKRLCAVSLIRLACLSSLLPAPVSLSFSFAVPGAAMRRAPAATSTRLGFIRLVSVAPAGTW